MLSAPYALLEDEPCPVSDETLGEMYRASARGLSELIASVPPTARALLAVYCSRRAHLASIGLTIAASCEKDDLEALGGNQVPAYSSNRGTFGPRWPPTLARMAGGK